jgi:uncharacterized protein
VSESGEAAIGPDGQPLLAYPLDYPIKVLYGRDDDSAAEKPIRVRLDAIVRHHAPDLAAERVTERSSREARFVSVTYVIVARSREQIVALVQELQATPGVVMVI